MGRNAVKGKEEVGSADGDGYKGETEEVWGRQEGVRQALDGWREAEEKDVGAKEVRRPASAGILRKPC